MKKFLVDVDAYKIEKKTRKDYGYSAPYEYEEERSILPMEVYEAITKYLQVKGFDAACVKVEDAEKDAVDGPQEG